jgi:branched-chain amino acid transport system substrate-binding protein
MRKRYVWGAAALSAVLLLGACGSSKKSTTNTTSAAGSSGGSTGGTTASTAGSSAGSSGSGNPVKIAFLSILSGPFSVPGGDNGFKLAVEQINASGGIMGRQIQYKEFNTDITPQGASTATALALQYHPDLVVGYGVSAGLAASAAALNAAGVLVIHNTLDKLTNPGALGSNLYFRLQPTVDQFGSGADTFLFGQGTIKKMYILHTSDAAPTDGASVIQADAKKNSVSTQTASVSPVVTDLTANVLAAKSFGAQAIWDWGYPTTDGLLIKQAAANGYTGSIMTFSAGAAAKAGLIPSSLLTNKVYAVTASCAPEVLNTPAAQAYATAFKAKYGTAPSTAVSNEDYDAVYLYKNAVTSAGKFDAKSVATALEKVDYQGVCGEEKADANHNLEHSLTILSFPNGQETLAKLVTNIQSPY